MLLEVEKSGGTDAKTEFKGFLYPVGPNGVISGVPLVLSPHGSQQPAVALPLDLARLNHVLTTLILVRG